MTKEDYMMLSKERLAELLVERDNIQHVPAPIYPQYPAPTYPYGYQTITCNVL